MRILRYLTVAACVGIIGGLGAYGGLVTPDRMPYQAIVIPEAAPASVRLGAEELARCLKLAGLGEMPIVSENEAPAGAPAIWLGNTAVCRSYGIRPEDFSTDEFIWQSGAEGLVIAGKDYSGAAIKWFQHPWTANQVYNRELDLGAFGSAGTLQGVYRFLMKFCGVRWYWPGADGEVIPALSELEIPALSERHSPAFGYRFPFFCDFADSPEDVLWFKRCGNGGNAPLAIQHSTHVLMRHEPLDSPLFAWVDGGRDSTKRLCAVTGIGEPCLSNPQVLDKAVNLICGYFAANPEQQVFPVVPNDGMTRICECPDCQAQLDLEAPEQGRFSNYVWGFVNKVAQEVGKQHPDRLVGCIAYEKYLMPPSKVELADNVAVQICKNRGAYSAASYRDQVNTAIASWTARVKHVYIWEYYLAPTPPWRGFPVFYPDHIAEDLRFLYQNGVKGEMIEAESWFGEAEPCRKHLMCPGMQHLNLYLTTQLYWEPELDVDALLEEYYTGFYGPARDPMRNFWELSRQLFQEGTRTALSDSPDPTNLEKNSPLLIYSPEEMKTLAGYLAAALDLTAPDSVYRRRIETIQQEFALAEKLFSRVARKSNPVIDLTAADAEPTRLVTLDGTRAEPATWFSLKDTGTGLLFTIACFEPEMDKLKANIMLDNDVSIWQDDCVEIFLAGDAAEPESCVQFIVAATGKIVQVRFSPKLPYGNREANCTLVPRVSREDNRWVIELEVPYELFGFVPEAGKKFQMNLFRNRRVNSGSVSCWSPILGARFYEPESFGSVTP